ncbi:MAG: lysophospholipid acyltransferase family protein [Thermotogota bacterium]
MKMNKIAFFFYAIYYFVAAIILLLYGYIQLKKALKIEKKHGREASQRYIRKRSPAFSRKLFTWCGIHPKIHHLEHLPTEGNYIICMNHQSYLDPMLVLGYISENIFLLAKDELNRTPFFKEAMQLFCITIDRENPKNAVKALRKILEYLKKGECIGIFPEGTRTRDGQIAPFAPGGLKIAYKSRKYLIPVIVNGTGQAMPRKSWIVRPAEVQAVVLEPVHPDLFDTYESFESNIHQNMQKALDQIRDK